MLIVKSYIVQCEYSVHESTLRTEKQSYKQEYLKALHPQTKNPA